jgi:hypothetical protein
MLAKKVKLMNLVNREAREGRGFIDLYEVVKRFDNIDHCP